MANCDLCGTERHILHKHHVEPKSLMPEWAHLEGNLVSLCANCHEDQHWGPNGDKRPWERAHTPEAQAKRSATMLAHWQDPDYRKKRSDGQLRRREAEAAGQRPMFSEAGLQQSISNLAKGWDPHVHAKAIEKSADMRRGTKASDKTRAKMSASHQRLYAEGRRQPAGRKLTAEIVREIRVVYQYGMAKELAERYGVSPQLIQDVAAGRRWTHVA